MPEQTTDERAKEAWFAALAYEVLCRAAEGGTGFYASPMISRVLHRIIGEPDYKAIAMDLWHELFVVGNGELLDQLRCSWGVADTEGAESCLKLFSPDASPTGDTPLPSKS